MSGQTDELRQIADTIETNGGWHVAAVKVRAAAEDLERLATEINGHWEVRNAMLAASNHLIAENDRLNAALEEFK